MKCTPMTSCPRGDTMTDELQAIRSDVKQVQRAEVPEPAIGWYDHTKTLLAALDEAHRECDAKQESLDGLTDSLGEAREKIELLKALGHGLVDDTGDTLSLLVERERERDEARAEVKRVEAELAEKLQDTYDLGARLAKAEGVLREISDTSIANPICMVRMARAYFAEHGAEEVER